VFVTVAVRTSDDPGPGVKHLPRAEASVLIGTRMAAADGEPPLSWPGASRSSRSRECRLRAGEGLVRTVPRWGHVPGVGTPHQP
jgi:hypothetical protein